MKPETTWNNYWKEYELDTAFDPAAKIVFDELSSLVGDFKGKTLLECGSGTGKISAMVAQNRGATHLLDYSSRALEFSRLFFNAHKLNGVFVEGSIFSIPYPDNSFDVVWNSGVLEHFPEEKQIAALSEMRRVCRAGGMIIAFNPFSKAYIYRIGKYFAEKCDLWPFGDEFPVSTLNGISSRAGLTLEKEYSFGYQLQFSFLKYYPIPGFCQHIIRRIFDRCIFKSVFNGYLLTSIFIK